MEMRTWLRRSSPGFVGRTQSSVLSHLWTKFTAWALCSQCSCEQWGHSSGWNRQNSLISSISCSWQVFSVLALSSFGARWCLVMGDGPVLCRVLSIILGLYRGQKHPVPLLWQPESLQALPHGPWGASHPWLGVILLWGGRGWSVK